MVKKILLSFLVLSFTFTAFARELVVDEVGVLSSEDKQAITSLLEKFTSRAESEASIVIVRSLDGKDAQSYADDYFDYNGYGFGPEAEGILLLIAVGDGTPGSGEMYISTHGEKTITTVYDLKIEDLLDALYYGGLANRDFASGFYAYIEELASCFGVNDLSATEAAGGAGAGVATFLLSILGIKNKNKVKATSSFYHKREKAISNFVPFNDALISSNVTTRRIPTSSSSGRSSSGHSTTHRSSSGRSHGGGGRRF